MNAPTKPVASLAPSSACAVRLAMSAQRMATLTYVALRAVR
jgi:hypothetical protein